MTCLSRATIFRRMKERKFLLAIIPSPGIRRWKDTEIIEFWILFQGVVNWQRKKKKILIMSAKHNQDGVDRGLGKPLFR